MSGNRISLGYLKKKKTNIVVFFEGFLCNIFLIVAIWAMFYFVGHMLVLYACNS